MNVIVTDTGFGTDDWMGGFVPFGEAANDVAALDVASDTNPADLADVIDRLTAKSMPS